MKKGKIFLTTLICVAILFATPTSFTQSKTGPPMMDEQQRLQELYPKTSYKYRGVVAGNIAWGDAAWECVIDFGSLGVYFWDPVGGFQFLTGDNPTAIIGIDVNINSGLEVVGDFGSQGIWLYSYGQPWTQLTTDNPSLMFAADDDGDGYDELHAVFPGLGVWRYDYDTGNWMNYTLDNPSYGLKMDGGALNYHEGAYSFGGQGTWSVYSNTSGSTVYWNQLTSDAFSDDFASARVGIANSEDLILDFFTQGLWLVDSDYWGSPQWYQLTTDDPYDIRTVNFAGDTYDEVVVTFGGVAGLWLWDYAGSWPGTWTQLTGDTPDWDEAFCEPVDYNGTTETSPIDVELAVDFGTGVGLWMYNSTLSGTKWTQLTGDSPRFMVGADLFGHGVSDCLICDFGTLGLWYWYNWSWYQITTDSPDP